MDNINNNEKFGSELGRRIRELRKGKGFKVIDIAAKTGLTSSFISQVERSLVSPSIETLKKIGDALDTPLSYFFEASHDLDSDNNSEDSNSINHNEQSPVVHIHQRKILSPQPGITFYLLNPDMSGPIEFIYNIYEPGAGTGKNLYSHPGHECGLILEGELVVTIRDKSYTLRKGDSITFASSEPHSKKNVGNTRCICVWANTPPWF